LTCKKEGFFAVISLGSVLLIEETGHGLPGEHH